LTAARLCQVPATCIHHSPARRATETATIIASQLPGIPVHASPLLRECVGYVPPAFRAWLAQAAPAAPPPDQREIPAAILPWLALWARRPGLDDVVNGERQAQQAFATYFPAAGAVVEHEIVISHAALIAYLVCRVLRVPIELYLNLEPYNCSISEVLVDGSGQTKLLSFNDAGHLPYQLRTSNEVAMSWFDRL
jgi:probable phosphoglycerate mutase